MGIIGLLKSLLGGGGLYNIFNYIIADLGLSSLLLLLLSLLLLKSRFYTLFDLDFPYNFYLSSKCFLRLSFYCLLICGLAFNYIYAFSLVG